MPGPTERGPAASHSNVGGVFETEDEIFRLLDTLGPNVIGVGPDTGHLRWAVDQAAFIRRYSDRIGGIHLNVARELGIACTDGTLVATPLQTASTSDM